MFFFFITLWGPVCVIPEICRHHEIALFFRQTDFLTDIFSSIPSFALMNSSNLIYLISIYFLEFLFRHQGIKAFREKLLADILEGKIFQYFGAVFSSLYTFHCGLFSLFYRSKHLSLRCTWIKVSDMWRCSVVSVCFLGSR